MVANMVGYGLKPPRAGAAGLPVCGYKVEILGEEGQELIPAQEGYVAVKLPLPPGCLPTLWEDNDRFYKSYLDRFPGYYMTGDGGYMDEDGYIWYQGRSYDEILTSGERLGPFEVERKLMEHPAVKEAGVVGVPDQVKGEKVKGFIVLNEGFDANESLKEELNRFIKENLAKNTELEEIEFLLELPKTRSGKIMRRALNTIK